MNALKLIKHKIIIIYSSFITLWSIPSNYLWLQESSLFIGGMAR